MNGKLKQKNQPALIMSVESRKGGVGKTTAALCLGKILKKKNYFVLMLDMDVTGTDAAVFENSSFWADELNVIKQIDTENNEHSPAKTVNLLSMFDQTFMIGKEIPRFTIDNKNQKALLVSPDRINVIGSQIYNTEINKGHSRNGNITCIENPQILFDDLHSIWLLEFINSIIERFISLGREVSKNIAIILDNSPGYVGFMPAIHEWLTDRGPEYSKFLMVTSIDTQDLIACDYGIRNLHNYYKLKWETSRLFEKSSQRGEGFEISKVQEQFFTRLANFSNEKEQNNDVLGFYRNIKFRENKKRDGQYYCDNYENYIGAIINRVPPSIKAKRPVIKFPEKLSTNDNMLIQLVTGKNEKNDFSEYMIEYDEYIDNQFLLPSLRQRPRKTKRNIYKIISLLKDYQKSLDLVENDYFLFENIENIEQYFDLQNILFEMNEKIIHLRIAMEEAGLTQLNRLIREEWLPTYIISEFGEALGDMIDENNILYSQQSNQSMHIQNQDKIEILRNDIMSNLKKYMSLIKEDLNSIILKTFINTIITLLLALSLKSFQELRSRITGILTAVVIIEIIHWNKGKDFRTENMWLQKFLISDKIDRNELKGILPKVIYRELLTASRSKDFELAFAKFYQICTKAQGRIIDFLDDAKFLFKLIQFVIEVDEDKKQRQPYIRGIADEVIIEKSIRHKNASLMMLKAWQTTEYYREFENVLNKIIDNWKIENA